MGTLPTILWIIFTLLLLKLVYKKYNKFNKSQFSERDNSFYLNLYQQKFIFTRNEKNAYFKIKAITDELNLPLFAKVRLFDLIEPQKTKYCKSAQWKIQAKHVDFVICNKNLIAKYIIELDDKSHDTLDRQERDAFVDAILLNTGYKILRVRDIFPEQIKDELSKI